MDLSDWYTETEAAMKLGLAPRTFRRFLSAGSHKDYPYVPEKKRRPRDGGKKPETVFKPRDVDTLASIAATHNRTLEPTVAAVPSHAAVTPETLLEYFVNRQSLAMQQNNKLYLTVKEAAQISGLPKSFLRQIAPKLGFSVGRNSWRIPRCNLADSAMVTKLAELLLLPPPAEETYIDEPAASQYGQRGS